MKARAMIEIKLLLQTEKMMLEYKGWIFKRSLANLQQNHVLSHFQFAQLFYLNTGYQEQFHGSNRVDWTNIYFLKITHLERDLGVQLFLKLQPK